MKISALIFIYLIAILASIPAQSTTLATNGKAKATIVLGHDATKPERYAASELATYLKKTTGATFKVTDIAPKNGSRIFVGQTATVKKLLKGFNWSKLRRDGIVIKTIGKDLVLAGDRPRGSMYAVYTFLEDQLGVRWWTAEAESVTKIITLDIGSLNTTYTPPFLYRETLYKRVTGTNNAAYAARMKLNGNFQAITPDMGGHYTILGWCHTFYQLLPPEKYFKDHPEWYSEINGTRMNGNFQLCLTNKEIKDEFVKEALKWIAKDPGAGMISIAQNDWGGACQCADCKALVEKTGSESGALITFVNSVAEEIEKQYPDFLIETLAYQYTRKAPTNAKPRDNVVVRLCTIECDFAHPLTAPSNSSFYQDLQNWKRISKHLYIWDYVVNFANLLIPHPNFQVLGKNLRTFKNSNVIGMFEQGDGYNPDSALEPMKVWVLSKLMWDPRLVERLLMAEFLKGYYGTAAPYIAEYMDILENLVTEQNPYLSCFTSKPAFYTPEALDASNTAFNNAENAVKNNPELLRRVKIQRLSLQHILILTTRQFALQDASIKGIDWQNIADDYLKLSDETGNIYIGEGSVMSDTYRANLKTLATSPSTVRKPSPPSRCTDLDKRDWVDCQEERFSLAGEWKEVSIINDEQASNGIAASMIGNTDIWAVQIPLQGSDFLTPTVSVYASVKIKRVGKTGPAFSFGIYDNSVRNNAAGIGPTIESITDDNYHEYYLGDVALKPGMYVWFAPPNDINQVESVTIDRVYFVVKK